MARRKLLSTQRFKEIEELLGSTDSAGSSTASTLVALLLKRAPVSFLEQHTAAELTAIVTGVAAHLDTFRKERRQPHIAFARRGDVTTATIVLNDGPFIVNTIAEQLSLFGVEIRLFLHPIIITGDEKLSVSYLELGRLEGPVERKVGEALSGALSDLCVVTSDFETMEQTTRALAEGVEAHGEDTLAPVDTDELRAFLRWLCDGNFIFLGYAKAGKSAKGALTFTDGLGVFRSAKPEEWQLARELGAELDRLAARNGTVSITKLRRKSPIHHNRIPMSIVLSDGSADGSNPPAHFLIGLLTSKAHAEESSSSPIVRRKLARILEHEQVITGSHDYKFIVDLVDYMPKEDALRLSSEAIHGFIETALEQRLKDEVRISVAHDEMHRGNSSLIIMPHDRFNSQVRDRVRGYLESKFGSPPGGSEFHLDVSKKTQRRFYFYLPAPEAGGPSPDIAEIELALERISQSWWSTLVSMLESYDEAAAPQLAAKYLEAFPRHYQALLPVEVALRDLVELEQLSDTKPIRFALDTESLEDRPETTGVLQTFVLFHRGEAIPVSKAVPIFENIGLEVLSERTFTITAEGGVRSHIHRYLVSPRTGIPVSERGFRDTIAPGLAELFVGDATNDLLNSLLLHGELDLRAISLLRTYCALLWQVNKFATRLSTYQALAAWPRAAAQLWNLFSAKFNPELGLSTAERVKLFARGTETFRDILRDITDITQDRIFRALSSLLEHTVRTNFYLDTGTIALKLHSERIDIMPQPRPLFEIFVNSPRVQGVHLRSGKIARGGIRWSDRAEDYRTEVLGLMKTQRTKNALIVPVGAKGGFILRRQPPKPEQIPAFVEQCYREFIRALLSITDNRVGDSIVHPKGVVVHDDPDPYFVVAADKGTATFSNIANEIAVKEFDFWLGDAFASGGSNGYDHKLYGITARGAWECTKRHFNDLGIDYESKPFTVTGIGDMSGDVFGNGLIISPQMRLIAAFNHKHIFLDPTPDTAKAFAERKRLFELPRSQWSDYSKELISRGGGVYGRFDKEISLTPEIRTALDIPKSVPGTVDGEQLITHILRAPVDLFWNGGIGTYFKAPTESNADVNDGTNDRVRVNSDELRAKVVAEGGNLGFTQFARVDFAQRGGRINTDAIDNSAGVDLSDHEVNLKLLFAGLMRSNKLSRPNRDALLKDLANEVCDAVLAHNRDHALILTAGADGSTKNIQYFQTLIREIHGLGYINRALEFLPDDQELSDRALKKQGLERPELAICIAAVKLWIKDTVLNSKLVEDPLLSDFLFNYFPDRVVDSYRTEVLQHPLGPNIIAIEVANLLVAAMGVTFVSRMCSTYSVSPITVLTCFLAADRIVGARSIREQLHRFDNPTQSKTFFTLWSELRARLMDATAWLLSYHSNRLSLAELVERYSGPYLNLLGHTDEVFVGIELARYRKRLAEYTELGLDEELARSFAVFRRILPILEMLWASQRSGRETQVVANAYSVILEELDLNSILKLESRIEPATKFEQEALDAAYEEIRRSVSIVTLTLLEQGCTGGEMIRERLRASESFSRLADTAREIKALPPTVSAISVFARQLRLYQL